MINAEVHKSIDGSIYVKSYCDGRRLASIRGRDYEVVSHTGPFKYRIMVKMKGCNSQFVYVEDYEVFQGSEWDWLE